MSETETETDKAVIPNNYHHGNLKEALVDAFIELLADTHADDISLRKLAAHVGVAPTAVYNHFDDRQALIVAVNIRCLYHLSTYVEQHLSGEGLPEDVIKELGAAYYRYASDFPHFFKLLFQMPVAESSITEELMTASLHAESKLRAVVEALLLREGLLATDRNLAFGTLACWSVAHGITCLFLNNINNAACLIGRWPEEFLMQDDASSTYIFDVMGDMLTAGIVSAIKNHQAAHEN